jgi:WD40 repeat protein
LGGAVLILLLVVALGSTVAAYRFQRANRQIQKSKDDALEQLWSSYLAEARARRSSGRSGQRFASLDAVKKAAALRATLEVRNEAIACLALSDVRPLKSAKFQWPGLEPKLRYDPALEQYAVDEGGEGTITVRRTADDAQLAVLRARGSVVNWIDGFSPDGRYLAVTYWSTNAGDHTSVWDLQKQEVVLAALPGWAVNGAFSLDSRRYALSHPDGALSLYSLTGVEQPRRLALNRHFGRIAFSPDGRRLAGVPDGSSVVELWDVETGALQHSTQAPTLLTSLAWSRDGRFVAAGCNDFRAYVWTAEDLRLQAVLAGHADVVIGIGFNQASTLAATSSWDGSMRLWVPETGQMILSAQGANWQVQFSPDGRRLTESGGFGVLEVSESSEYHRLYAAQIGRDLAGPAFSADGRIIAAEIGNRIRFWATDSGRELASFEPLVVWDSLLFHPDGTSLFSSERSGGIYRRDLACAQSNVWTLAPPRLVYQANGLRQAAVSADGRYLAAANFDKGEGLVLDLEHPAAPVPLRSHDKMDAIALSPDGRWAASASWHNSEVRVWNARSGEPAATLTMPHRAAVAFSPDGRWLATCSTDYRLWEVGSWRPQRTLSTGHSVPHFNHLAFSPDGRTIALLKLGLTMQLLEVPSGRVLADLEAPNSSRIFSLAFSPDGSQLAALGGEQVQIWNLRLIRSELKAMGLDWDLPAYPPALDLSTNHSLTLTLQ